MINAINSITIYVANQNASLRFYRDVLGFEVRRYEPLGPAGSWIEVAPPNQHTALVLYPRSLMEDWESRRGFMIFGCDDLEATFEELTAKGVTFTSEPTSMGWGSLATFADIDGNEFGLMQVTKKAAPPGGKLSRPPGAPPPRPPPPPGGRR